MIFSVKSTLPVFAFCFCFPKPSLFLQSFRYPGVGRLTHQNQAQTAKPLISFDDYSKNIPGHIAAIE